MMVNSMKTSFLHSQVFSQHPQLNMWSKPDVDTFFQVKLTRNSNIQSFNKQPLYAGYLVGSNQL